MLCFCTRDAEGSDLEQILSRLRNSSSRGTLFGAMFPGRASPCSTPPTLPGSMSVVPASSLCRGAPFAFRSENQYVYSYVQKHGNLIKLTCEKIRINGLAAVALNRPSGVPVSDHFFLRFPFFSVPV